MRRPRKVLVTARQDDDAPTVRLSQSSNSTIELAFVTSFLGSCFRIAEGLGFGQFTDQPVDCGSDDVLRFSLFEHVHAFVFNVRGVVDGFDTVSD